MTRVECGMLLAFIAELDYRKFSEVTVEAWHEVLGHYEYQECRTAVVAHYDTSEPDFLKPSHISSQIRAARRKRMGEVTRFEVNPVDDGRGNEAPKAAFDEFKRVRTDLKNAVGSGLISREQYHAYLAGRTPWFEFKAQLRNRALE